MKKTKILFSTLAMIILIAGVFLYLNFGNLAKNAAERIASNALGVNVSISSLSFSLKEKKATLSGIRISNPPGFKKSHIITADNIQIGFNTASRQLIDFKRIDVNGTVINLEVTEKGTNLQALKNLAGKKKQKESVGSEQVRVIVRNMVINESTINPSVTLLNRDVGSIKLPPVRVSGIGQNSSGALAKDAVSQIIVQYLRAAERQAGSQGLLSGAANAVVDEVKGAVDGAVDDVKNNLKGLFN